MTLNYSFNDKEKPKAEELNYEFANYIELEEEEYNHFFYINSEKRNRFIIYLIDGLRRIPYIEICGPIGCGKTVTLLKFINCIIRRSYYINLLTVNCLGIEELKKVLKYEYVKIIGKNYSEENEKDEIISYIQKLNSSKEIFDFILNIISSLNNFKKKIYLIIDQYSSKYDENNEKLKEIKDKIINSNSNNIKFIVCSSTDNYDVKNNLAFSLSFSEKNEIKNINYFYIGCILRLEPNEEPLKMNLLNLKVFYQNLVTPLFFIINLKKLLE